jgi:hypothetical protein
MCPNYFSCFTTEDKGDFLMRFRRPLARYTALLVAVVLLLQLVGCGTVIYPERRGQKAGRIDVGIAVLDGLGLLLFLIPGVIAFAVDFSTGAIYLPSGKSGHAQNRADDDIVVIKVPPEELSLAKLDEVLLAYTGEQVNLQSDALQVSEADENVSVKEQLKTLSP